jgi:hypothetical protein
MLADSKFSILNRELELLRLGLWVPWKDEMGS